MDKPLFYQLSRPLPSHQGDMEATKSKTICLEEKEEHSKIIKTIKCRERNFEENKSKMLSSAFNKKRSKINTTNIIYEEEFIKNSDLVKIAVRQSATK